MTKNYTLLNEAGRVINPANLDEWVRLYSSLGTDTTGWWEYVCKQAYEFRELDFRQLLLNTHDLAAPETDHNKFRIVLVLLGTGGYVLKLAEGLVQSNSGHFYSLHSFDGWEVRMVLELTFQNGPSRIVQFYTTNADHQLTFDYLVFRLQKTYPKSVVTLMDWFTQEQDQTVSELLGF